MEKKQKENGIEIKEVLNKTELYISRNQRIIYIVVGAILVIVLGYFGYIKLYLEPKEKEAAEMIFGAENRFNAGEYDLAVKGDAKFLGFEDIIDSYSATKSGKLARYYAGLSHLHLGQFEEAISYLKSYKGQDAFTKLQAWVCIGDAYMELGNLSDAIHYYKKAAHHQENEIMAPYAYFRLGLASYSMKQYQEALDAFKEIKTGYPRSSEAREIDKYIALAEGSLQK